MMAEGLVSFRSVSCPCNCKNPAWTNNESILEVVNDSPTKVRLAAAIPDFENAFFGESAKDDKPYNALHNLKGNPEFQAKVKQLLVGLIDHEAELPEGIAEWSSFEYLEEHLNQTLRP